MSPDQFSGVVFEGLRFAGMRWVADRMRGKWRGTAYELEMGTPEASAWVILARVITRVAAPFNRCVGAVRVGGADPWAGLRAVVALSPDAEHGAVAATYLHEWLCSRDSAWLWRAFEGSEADAFKANGLWPEGLPVAEAGSLQHAVPRTRGRVSP